MDNAGNTYFDSLRQKLERDFISLQKSPSVQNFSKTKTKQKQLKNFTFFSSEKKLPNKEGRIMKPSTQKKRENNKFLTPMLLRHGKNPKTEKDNLGRTHWKSEVKVYPEPESPDFLKKYLTVNGLRSNSLQDVFDVLRLENPDFKVIDNKIRTLLCLIKTLVVRAVMIENGNKNKNPELGNNNSLFKIEAKRNFDFQKQCIDDIEQIRSRFGHELGSLDLIFEKLASMLSSPLMMDHVRSYYQNKSENEKTSLLRKEKLVKNKYIHRTRKRRREGCNVKRNGGLLKKRAFEEEKDSGRERMEMKMVLMKQGDPKEGQGKFSLKRVSQA
jgi:hypothetical protein